MELNTKQTEASSSIYSLNMGLFLDDIAKKATKPAHDVFLDSLVEFFEFGIDEDNIKKAPWLKYFSQGYKNKDDVYVKFPASTGKRSIQLSNVKLMSFRETKLKRILENYGYNVIGVLEEHKQQKKGKANYSIKFIIDKSSLHDNKATQNDNLYNFFDKTKEIYKDAASVLYMLKKQDFDKQYMEIEVSFVR